MNISIDLANKIVNYLATKPFIEVAELIGGLQEAGKDLKPTKDAAPSK